MRAPATQPNRRGRTRENCHRIKPGFLWLTVAALMVLGTSESSAETPALPPLSTVPGGSPRLPGKFVWADLVTDNVVTARQFYGRLFNWTFRDLGGYTIASNEER